MTSEGFAPAKINLALHVTGVRDDGYHLLDSMVVFAGVGDRLWIKDAPEMSLEVTGPFSQGVPADRRNLVWQAAELAQQTCQITLEKNLPHGAGIGGGSADAAALLRILFGDAVASGIGLENALSLGADLPVCLSAAPQRMQGIGDRLSRIWPVPACHVVLVNPKVAVPTKSIFSALIRKENPPMSPPEVTNDLDKFVHWLSKQRNDLETPAISAAPAIQEVLHALSDAMIARMSGSGSTCFGIYPHAAAAQRAAAQIKSAHPSWWVVATQTIGANPNRSGLQRNLPDQSACP